VDLYINGELVRSYGIEDVRTQKIEFNDGPLYVGKAHTYDAVDGVISNFRYFNWRISSQEVRDDYKSAKGDIIRELLANNEQLANENKDNQELFNSLQENSPKVLWIGCVDARAPPELITKAGFGELFVHRNIGNQFNPDDTNCMSVLECAVNHLKVPHIVVCGHTGCGGARYCFEPNLEPNLGKWTKGIRDLEAVNSEFSSTNPYFTTAEVQEKLVKANVVRQVEKISQHYLVQSAKQKIQIHGFVFDLKNVTLVKVT